MISAHRALNACMQSPSINMWYAGKEVSYAAHEGAAKKRRRGPATSASRMWNAMCTAFVAKLMERGSDDPGVPEERCAQEAAAGVAGQQQECAQPACAAWPGRAAPEQRGPCA